jgi:S1-C subfamily serine protease
MKQLFIILILLSASQFWAQAKYSISDSLVIVNTEANHGTGFVVKSDSSGSYIITNKHVCRDYLNGEMGAGLPHNQFTIIWSNFSNFPTVAKFIRTSPNHDLCLLKVDNKNIPYARISWDNPYLRQFVRSIGNPGDKRNVKIAGKVGSLKESWFGEYVVQFNGDIQAGASGSPVYDEKEEVVGVACGGAFGKNDAVFVNGKYLREFLNLE